MSVCTFIIYHFWFCTVGYGYSINKLLFAETLEELKLENTDLQGEITSLQSANASLQGEVASLQSANASLQGEVTSLKEAHEREIAALKDQLRLALANN
jgi:FtsZ-binding cell division protein ZapB